MAKEFYFDNMGVGYFKERSPKEIGDYAYEPFRGPGHYDMQEQLHNGNFPRCYYVEEGFLILFTVRKVLEYGALKLDDFRILSLTDI